MTVWLLLYTGDAGDEGKLLYGDGGAVELDVYTVGEALLLLEDDDRLKLELVEDCVDVEDPYRLVDELEAWYVLLAATLLLEEVDVVVELVL